MIRGSLGMINGINVVTSAHLPRFKIVQYRFPKTKKKRIQKKWKKQKKNFKQIPINTSYVINGNTLIVHPDDLNKLEHLIQKEQSVQNR